MAHSTYFQICEIKHCVNQINIDWSEAKIRLKISTTREKIP